MGDEFQITLIATGFERSRVETSMQEAGSLPIRQPAPIPQPPSPQRPVYQDVEVDAQPPSEQLSRGASPFRRQTHRPPAPPPQDPRTYENIDPKNTDLPAFLRKRNRNQ